MIDERYVADTDISPGPRRECAEKLTRDLSVATYALDVAIDSEEWFQAEIAAQRVKELRSQRQRVLGCSIHDLVVDDEDKVLA